MNWLIALGWTGNGFYFSRFLVQWLKSERAGKSVAPPIFWWLSLAGAASLGAYSFLEGDKPLFVGYALTFVIYLRNITIATFGERAGRIGPLPALCIALLASVLLIVFGAVPRPDSPMSTTWLTIAFLGQAVFSARFVIQWYATERSGSAHFPRSFWWFSLVGNLALLAYAIKRGDPVFIAGFALGPLVQIRNLMLPEDEHKRAKVSQAVAPELPG